MHLENGQIFAGRYRLDAPLARGGFAQIYQATQLNIERTVALKILSPPPIESLTTPYKLEQRFKREARLLGQLHNPHIVTLHDYGTSEQGQLFMAFEFIEGKTLKEVAQEEGPLGEARLRPLLVQALSALADVHRLGVLHRDIKPHNIMLQRASNRPECLKLLDFGISKRLTASDTAELTREDAIIGTPRYMSPEQMRGKELSPASDLYSLGLVCYELSTGRSPFATQDIIDILGRLFEGPVTLPGWVDLGPELRGVIEQMILLDPQQRQRSCEEVLEQLGEVVPVVSEAPRSVAQGATFPMGLDLEGMSSPARTTIQSLTSVHTRPTTPLPRPRPDLTLTAAPKRDTAEVELSPSLRVSTPTWTQERASHTEEEQRPTPPTAAQDRRRLGPLLLALGGVIGIVLVAALQLIPPAPETPPHEPVAAVVEAPAAREDTARAIAMARTTLHAHLVGAALAARQSPPPAEAPAEKSSGRKKSSTERHTAEPQQDPFRPPIYVPGEREKKKDTSNKEHFRPPVY